MKAGLTRGALLLFVVWVGLVLLRYQEVASPEPLAALALALLSLAVLTLASLGGGLAIVGRLGADRISSPERLLLGTVTGAGVLMALAAGLGLVGLLRPVPLLAILAVMAVAGIRPAARELAGRSFHLARRARWQAAWLGLAALGTLLVALTPSPFYDQLHYHLAFPYHWLRAGTMITFPRHSYSFLPANMGLLYTYALATLGVWAAQAAHWWMGALATLATGLLSCRLAGPRAGWWGAALFGLTPSVLLVSTWAAADLATAALAASAWLVVVAAWRDPDLAGRPLWWGLAGALAGLACGCKLLALAVVAAPMAVAVLLASQAPFWQRVTRRAMPLLVGVALTLAPWLIRDMLLTGNPVYPFLGGVFGSGGGAAAASTTGIARVGSPLAEPMSLITLSTFTPGGDAGELGPLFLALAPLAVWTVVRARRRGAAALAIGVGLGLLGWAVGPLLGRYVLPLLAPLAALEAAGIARLRRHLPHRWRPWLASLLGLVLGWGLLGGTSAVELRRLAASLGYGDAGEILRQYASYWPAVSFVNERLPRDAKVLLVGESRSMYLDRDVDVEDPFVVPRLTELARSCTSPEAMATRLHRDGITHVLINRHEAGRIAALNGRQDYFAPLTSPERARLDAFLASQLTPVFDARPVTVYRLAPKR